MQEKGGISVETKNIFPVIKRWLYSDKDIFVRELVSNASDAVTKLKRLYSLGDLSYESLEEGGTDYRIDITLDTEKSTLSFADNGIGMSAGEIKKYITQIAISGALEFLEKYEKEESAPTPEEGSKNGIIGHFGLGFYSAFMVADRVDIKSKSFDGSPAVYWTCEENGDYEMTEFSDAADSSPEDPDKVRSSRGTEIILYVNEDNKEYLNENKIKESLQKYCAFMPVEIYFTDVNKTHDHHDHKDGEECEDCVCKPINDINPLWNKNPSSCTEEEYKDFYRKVFRDFKDPLFHIHINADYPLNFKGILYFPKINTQFDSLEGEVKLFYNQVFVADNIKEVVPEYLLMLKGVIDCPELPLNVSRSYLQNSGYVSKITAHIVKKVGDRLSSLFNLERERYEGFWDDIKTFIEYGCIRDRKFFERMKDIILYKNTESKYKTIAECIENLTASGDGTVKLFYSSDPLSQAVYVNMHKRLGHEVFIFDNLIENQFISMVEMESEKNGKKIKFIRVDAETDETANPTESGDFAEETKTALVDLFKVASGDNAKVKFEVKPLSDAKLPVLFVLSEESRRISEMMRQYNMLDKNSPLPPNYEETLIINSANPLIKKLADNTGANNAGMIVKQIYNVALINSRKLTADELENFTADTVEILINALDI